jgi:hypothetical protein
MDRKRACPIDKELNASRDRSMKMQDCCESRFALYSIYVIWKEITVEGFSEEALYLQTRHIRAVQSDEDRKANE